MWETITAEEGEVDCLGLAVSGWGGAEPLSPNNVIFTSGRPTARAYYPDQCIGKLLSLNHEII